MNKDKWNNIKEIFETTKGLLTRKVKAILFSVAASLVIGVIFGMISLQMADRDAGSVETVNTSISSNEKTGTEASIESTSFFVVQAGIFKEEDNANAWADRFSQNEFPAVKWTKNKELYLLTGIAATEEAANKEAKAMDEAGLDVFVKKWETVGGKVSGAHANDAAYLGSFQKSWQESLEAGNASKLKEFAEADAEVSEAVQPFVDKLKALVEDDNVNQQQLLLESIHAYEKLSQK